MLPPNAFGLLLAFHLGYLFDTSGKRKKLTHYRLRTGRFMCECVWLARHALPIFTVRLLLLRAVVRMCVPALSARLSTSGNATVALAAERGHCGGSPSASRYFKRIENNNETEMAPNGSGLGCDRFDQLQRCASSKQFFFFLGIEEKL